MPYSRGLYSSLRMDILGRSILILGGYGLVGQAVARRLLQEGPRRLTLLSLKREEAEEAVRLVAPEAQGTSIDAAWGGDISRSCGSAL